MSIDREDLLSPEKSERIVCNLVVAEPPLRNGELSLAQLFVVLKGGRKLIFIVTLLATFLAALYSFLAPPVFSIQSQVLVQPRYGDRALAVVQSVNFLEAIVAKQNFLPWIFRDKWDEESESWKVSDEKVPSHRLGALYLQRHMKVRKNGRFARISLNTIDPLKGVDVIRTVIDRANAILVNQVVTKARNEIRSLQSALAEYDSLLINNLAPEVDSMVSSGNDVSRELLIDTILTSLETKLLNSRSYEERAGFIAEIHQSQTLISEALGQSDSFALMVIEEAVVPERKEKIWPKGSLMIPAGFIGGLFISIAVVLGRGTAGLSQKVPG